jgi:hypothetical protein
MLLCPRNRRGRQIDFDRRIDQSGNNTLARTTQFALSHRHPNRKRNLRAKESRNLELRIVSEVHAR